MKESERLSLEADEFLERPQRLQEQRAAEKAAERKHGRDADRAAAKRDDEALHFRFVDEGFQVVTTPLELKDEAQVWRFTKPNPKVISKTVMRDTGAIFDRLFPREVFEHIATETNKAMRQKRFKVTFDTYRKYHRETVTDLEILHILVLSQCFRLRGGPKTIAKQLKEKPPLGLEKWPMTAGRYSAITTSMTANFPILEELLRAAWRKCVTSAARVAVDESLFAFSSKTDPTCPKRYIPRKPHPNGLLLYVAGSKFTNKVPYVGDLRCDTQKNAQLNARETMLNFMARFPKHGTTPFVTLDAGFSGEETMQALIDMGCLFVMSVNAHHKKWLYQLLGSYCPENHSLTVVDKNGIMWSVYKSTLNTFFTASNAFKVPEQLPPPVYSPPLGPAEVNLLSRFSKRALQRLAAGIGIQGDDLHAGVVDGIVRFLNEPDMDGRDRGVPTSDDESQDSEEDQESEPEQDENASEMENTDSDEEVAEEDSDEDDGAGSSASGEEPRSEEGPSDLDDSEEEDESGDSEGEEEEEEEGPEPRLYTKEELSKFTNPDLKEIMALVALKPKGRKQENIDAILRWQDTPEDKTKEAREKLDAGARKKESEIHKVYRDCFNPIDLHDGFWNPLQPKHFMKAWRGKLVYAVLCMGLVNLHAINKTGNPKADMDDTVRAVVNHVLTDDFEF